MKISNEIKIGVISLAAIIILVIGFNFLKGKQFFNDETLLVAKYNNIQGLQPSNPVMINGMQVGSIYRIIPDKYMRDIVVEMNISKNISIPTNSIALIKANPLGTTAIEIKLGDTQQFLANKDTILTEASLGMFNEVLQKVDPVLFEVRKAVSTIDTLAYNFNTMLDPQTKNNLAATVANMNRLTASLAYTSASIQQMVNDQNSALAASMRNVNSITKNFANQNDKINSIMTNLDKTTTNVSQLELDQTVKKLNDAAEQLKQIAAKLNSKDGSIGLLLNDPKLYNNLASSGNKLNLLLDDIRINPKRYINVSVFGKKQTIQPLVTPLPDTLHAPYYVDTLPPPAVPLP